jgi:hypothetical protein
MPNSEQTAARCPRYRRGMPFPVPTSMDPSPLVTSTGAAWWLRGAVGIAEILGVGLLVPIAILAVGTPVVLVVRLLIELAQRL